MATDLAKALAALTRRVARLAASDADLRADLRALARAILESEGEPAAEAERSAGPVAPPPELLDPCLPAAATEPEIRAPAPAPGLGPLPALTLGSSRPPEGPIRPDPFPAAVGDRPEIGDADLPTIRARCRLKADGVRWAAARRRKLDAGADFRDEVAPKDREILDRANALPDCYLWMNTPDFLPPADPGRIDDAAAGFEAVAAAIELIGSVLGAGRRDGASLEQALDLLAEAQSALRVAVHHLDEREDKDQFRAYLWLKSTTARLQIYVRRFMRIGDPADPAQLAALMVRIDAADEDFQESRRGEKQRASRLGQLRYHARLIEQGTAIEANWPKVAEVVDGLVADGVPPSSPSIREHLLPIVDELMPEWLGVAGGFGLALREIDRFLATQEAPPGPAVARPPTPEVEEVARLLRGRSALLIGGVRRPGATAALESAFGLDHLLWPDTREHQSIEPFRPLIARPEVAVVLLAIRWSNHSFGDLKRDCDLEGKPLVRLKAGYNPNQVAAQVLAQVGDQLKGL